ncbi:MAG: hypothetical protein ACK5OB_21420 [Pirellula sp.]
MNPPKEKQFTIWQLMKGVAIAAFITSALVPWIRESDEILANPGLFVVVMALFFLVQAPLLFLPNFIDWVLGNKKSKPSE